MKLLPLGGMLNMLMLQMCAGWRNRSFKLKTVKNYCVTHEPSLLPEKFIDFAIGLGDYQPANGLNISKIDSFWHESRPLAYGAAGAYVIPYSISKNNDTTDLTGICSYRKVVIRPLIGRESINYPTMREVSTEDLSPLSRDEITPCEGYDFLVSTPLRLAAMGGVVAQYARVHHVIDLFDYLSIANQLGVMSPSDIREFTLQLNLVPGGCELGVFPTTWLNKTISKLEVVGREFLSRHADRVRGYDSYQVRAVGFLSERLGSFFLLRELFRRYPQGMPRDIFGYMCCVVGDNSYTPSIS